MTTSSQGLTHEKASRRLELIGPNCLPEHKPTNFALVFLRQFKSPFIYVLLVAAVVSFALGQTVNSFFIFLVLMINAAIGSWQEYTAQKAASGLKKMVPHRATVYRDGKTVVIDAVDIVPGDIVMLVSGDKVPADIELHELKELEIDESMLTGESIAVEKDADFSSDESMPLGDRLNIAYAGTIILRGRARGEVIATGAQTEIGKIAEDVTESEDTDPPLVQRIHSFTMRVTYSMLILISLIFFITVMRGDDLATVFFLGVALAVSAIPEGLPISITVALSIGMRRMVKVGVIIRNLVAVESLGSCTFIASDKTGTLTVNEMTVRKIALIDGSSYSVSGEGTDLHGEIENLNQHDNKDLLEALYVGGVLANEARLETTSAGVVGHGDAVDIAFLVLAEKAGIEVDTTRRRFNEVGNIPYESHNAYAASVNCYHDDIMLFVKGSVERLIEMASPGPELDNLVRQADDYAQHGYRVLGIARRKLDATPKDPKNHMEQLELIGIVGMIDPLRPEVIDAVRSCREADVKVAMVTGDHPLTANVLASELGITRQGITRETDKSVTGVELSEALEHSQQEFDDLVTSTRVFARVAPHQKMEIVESLIEDGEFVAVTGDGINDAPALKHSHVGVSMGKRGTDVARESSDIILTDDHFSSIVKGIKQGRIVYNNIRKVIYLLISTGASEITLIILSILFGLPLPLMPLQLLWLNLATNGVQDKALVFEPEEGHELKKPPRSPDEPIFDRLMIERVVVSALYIGIVAFIVFKWLIDSGMDEFSARNLTLLLMVLFENVHTLNSRSETASLFRMNFFSNPFLLYGMLAAQAIHIGAMYTPGLRDILMIEPVTFEQWFQLLPIAMSLIIIDEAHKAWHKRSTENITTP